MEGGGGRVGLEGDAMIVISWAFYNPYLVVSGKCDEKGLNWVNWACCCQPVHH